MDSLINMKPSDISCNKDMFNHCLGLVWPWTRNEIENKISNLSINIRKIVNYILDLCDEFCIDYSDNEKWRKIINSLIESDNFWYKWLWTHLNTIMWYESKVLNFSDNQDKIEEQINNTNWNKIVILFQFNWLTEINSNYWRDTWDKILNKIYSKLSWTELFYWFKCSNVSSTTFSLFKNNENQNSDDNFHFSNNWNFRELLVKFLDILNIEINTILLDSNNEVDSNTINFSICCWVNYWDYQELYKDTQFALTKSINEQEIVFYDENYRTENYERKRWINIIQEAINSNKLVSYFQPLVDNKTWIIKSYEALVRLIDWDYIIAPGAFIDYLEWTETLSQLTSFMIEKTLNAMIWNIFSFSINFTERDLKDNRQVEKIIFLLEEFNIDPSRLIIEIYEWVTTKNDQKIQENLEKIKTLWIKIAIDDFWSKNSDFWSFKRYKPDFVKIDWSLIKELMTDKTNIHYIKGIIKTAHEKWIKVVVEYIENRDVFVLLNELWGDYSQWYYFWKPAKDLLEADTFMQKII